MRHQEDPFVAAEKRDPGLSSERVERPAGPSTADRQRTPNPQLGARNESSVLFKLTDIQAASSGAPAEDLPVHLDTTELGGGRQPRPTGFIELGHFEAPQSLAAVIPMGLLQPRGTTTYIPRWVWGLAAGGAALLLAVVGMTVVLLRSPVQAAPELATADPTAEPIAAAPAKPATAAPAAPAAPIKLVASASSKPAATSSTAPVARARAKAAHHGKRSARRVARASSSKSSMPTSADAPAPRARASSKDELDKILGGSVAH